MNYSLLHTYKHLIFILFFIFNTVNAQQSSPRNSEFYHLKFDESDGYIIDDIKSMTFDDDGWLWLSGISYESRNYKLGVKDLIILRFNGQTFYEVTIPDYVLEGATDLTMQKSFGNSLYLKVEAEQNVKLFKLDPRRLVFSEIELPNSDSKNNLKYELLKLKEEFLLIQQHPAGNRLFYMDTNDSFIPAGKMNTNVNIVGAHHVEFEDKLIISKFNFGSELYTKTSDSLEKIEINSTTPFSKHTIIESTFYQDAIAYMIFNGDSNIYTYDKETKEIITSPLFQNNDRFSEQIMFQDRNGNSLFKQAEGQQAQLQVFSNFENKPVWAYKFDSEITNKSIFASRDLTKEVILDNYNVLEVFIFDSDVVSTFLESLSIRNITQLEDHLILVATDFNGWYILDLKNKKVTPYWPLENQRKLTPQLNRDIAINEGVIWSNDGGNLLKVDLTSNKAQSFNVNNNLFAMTQDKETIIFVDVAGNLKTFDKQSYHFNTLIEKDVLNYENLVLHNDAIYATTSNGLKYIKDQEKTLFTPSNQKEDNYLVAIEKYTNDQFLIGTRSGKLFVFNTTTKVFNEIYKDELSASIASILVDDNDRIWLNTFAGIVAFDPKTKTSIRFGINDGLSHYEANRFSALKLNNGHFLIGTVKGLNYFHPDSLIASYNKNRYNHKLQLVSVEKFDSKKNTVITILDRTQLDEIKTITLPAKNKNLVLNFGILKPRLNIDYSYRYRLKESNWMEIDNKHEIRLLNMESGNHTIEIQAIDKTKNEVLSSLSLDLEVKQFFYESVWFYIFITITSLTIVLVYTYKWRQVNQANYKNKLLHTEIEYKKKDLADFATNISRNQQWNDYLITKMEEIKASKGRKKGAALINLEKEIKEKNSVLESNFEFQKRIDVLNNEFYNSLLKRYPDLSKTEIKLCSLIRLNLDNYDIATLQNVDISSVYKSRYRLRKKLNISSDTDLDAFLKAF